MKNLLVTGSNGQLGSELQTIATNFPDCKFFFTDVDELDICDSSAIEPFISQNKIDFIINCAAYTAVDKAENDKDLATKINIGATENLAKASVKYGSTLIHISTDYVFDGTNHRPYIESDATNPNSHYGYTKAEAEKIIQKICKQAIIIRTSWLYSTFGNNFVKTMLKYGTERDELKVVNDQIGTPTYAADLASTIINLITNHTIETVEIYNFSNEGVCSWYDFAKEIIELKNIDCKITPIEGKDYPTPANRPFYSVLNKSKISKTLNIEIPHWKDSLKICLKNL